MGPLGGSRRRRLSATKPVPITRLIREIIIAHESASNAEISAKLVALGHSDVKTSTIATLRAGTTATLRVLRDLGMLRSRPRRPRVAAAEVMPAQASGDR